MSAFDWFLVIGINVALFTSVGYLTCAQSGRRIVRFFKRLRIAFLEAHLADCNERLAKWDYYSHPDHWEWEDEKKGLTPWRCS
jgi:hypothetical protein